MGSVIISYPYNTCLFYAFFSTYVSICLDFSECKVTYYLLNNSDC